MIRRGDLRADKVQYKDGIGCCIWHIFPNSDDEEVGICWDFSYDDLDDIIALLQELKVAPLEYVEEE